MEKVKARRGQVALTHQLNDLATRHQNQPTDPDLWHEYAPAITRWEQVLSRPAPPPTATSGTGREQASAMFVEWLMGLPEGWVTDPALRLTRAQQWHALGNGVVPQQAAAALRMLVVGYKA
ncbi:MAG: hypothetical protein LBK95_12315 [Bifidobacteriaceae bacterium]|jgi:DNA (cytosine-5)-methyltransferase 1|nr:hypothetical protein [Bifidobacteriaceae bacterium]